MSPGSDPDPDSEPDASPGSTLDPEIDGDSACPDCGGELLPFPVPEELQDALPGEQPGATLCARCLELRPIDEPPASAPDFRRISDAFPPGEGGLPFALLLGLLPNLALYRGEITGLLERVERAGTDPLLALDRLAAEPDIETELDLAGRRRQLEQLL